ncbi:MAG: hypothetical protein HWE30_04420 [Methylocystaceae bacterium]|nr:hypothetical protein [Methylocystaceae bacterium]
MLKQATIENRRTRHHQTNVKAILFFGEDTHEATVLDISTGGAKVVWVHGKDCGLQFNDDQDCLSEFLYNLAIYGTA